MGVYSPTITKIIGDGNPPTITLGSVAGIGATATVSGNNLSGKVSIKTGSSLTLNANGTLATLTLADGVSYPNSCNMIVEPINSDMAGILMSFYVSTTSSTASLNVASLTLTTGTTYSFSYIITGI